MELEQTFKLVLFNNYREFGDKICDFEKFSVNVFRLVDDSLCREF